MSHIHCLVAVCQPLIKLLLTYLLTQPIVTEFDGKAAHWPRMNPLDLGAGNPNRVTLGLR